MPHLRATYHVVPHSWVEDPQNASDYVAHPPPCGPLLILSPTLSRWGLHMVGVMKSIRPLVGHF